MTDIQQCVLLSLKESSKNQERNQKEVALLNEDVLFHQGMYLHKDPERMFV